MTFNVKQLSKDTIWITGSGRITAEDYKKNLLPVFEKYYRAGEKVRVLIQFGDDFEGYTPGAAWQDTKLGFRYMRVIERCAVVSDIGWLRNISHFFGSLIPCGVATYNNDQLSEAKEWLVSGAIGLDHSLDKDDGILNVEIHAPISSLNIEILSRAVDNYIESNGTLNGLVIHVKKFPGWENLGSMISHMRFVKNHHEKIKRLALVTDSAIADIAENFVQHFVHAQIKHFKFDQLNEANQWVRSKE